MCMEDIRIGRELGGEIRQATSAGATPTLIMPSDTYRTSLILSGNGTADCYVLPENLNFALASGFALTAESPVLNFTLDNAGPFLRGRWFIYDGGTPVVVTAISTSLRRE